MAPRRLRIGAVGAALAAAACVALSLLASSALLPFVAIGLGLLAVALLWLAAVRSPHRPPPAQPAAGAISLGLMAFRDGSTLPRSRAAADSETS